MALDRKVSRWIVLVLVPMAILSTYELAAGAARLQIPGIDGEGPGDSIVLVSFGFAAPEGPLQVTKQIDGTSPQLAQLVVSGQQIPSMALTADLPESGAVVFAFFDVLITSLVNNGSTESLTFMYGSRTQARSVGSATFGGRVTDLCTGKPVEGASIGLTPVDSTAPGSSQTASSRTGAFKFTALATGDYRLVVSASGHLDFEKIVAVVGARGQSESVALLPLTSAGCL